MRRSLTGSKYYCMHALSKYVLWYCVLGNAVLKQAWFVVLFSFFPVSPPFRFRSHAILYLLRGGCVQRRGLRTEEVLTTMPMIKEPL